MTRRRPPTEINAGSMADIAFLLLIFFLVATTMKQDKGLTLGLPPLPEEPPPTKDHPDRNLFKIQINSKNQLLVEGKERSGTAGIKEEVKEFILNPGRDRTLSDSPQKAIISLKTDRGSRYDLYIEVLDALKGAYYEIYGEKVGLTSEEFRQLDTRNPEDKAMYDQAREGIPMNISIAEPTAYKGD
ncbi:MAG: ExbD/TolR family protein [Cyclobacteriaceae bacterium]